MKWQPVKNPQNVIDVRGKAKYGPHLGNKDKGEYYNPKVRKLVRKYAGIDMKQSSGNWSLKRQERERKIQKRLNGILAKHGEDKVASFGFLTGVSGTKKYTKQLKRAHLTGYY